jgi:hypothetical protein
MGSAIRSTYVPSGTSPRCWHIITGLKNIPLKPEGQVGLTCAPELLFIDVPRAQDWFVLAAAWPMGMQRRSCRGERLLHLIRDPRVWVQSVGEGGQPSCWGRGSRRESDFGSRMANRREPPHVCVRRAGRGFVPKPQRQQKSCLVPLLYFTIYPFPMACARKIQNDLHRQAVATFSMAKLWVCRT